MVDAINTVVLAFSVNDHNKTKQNPQQVGKPPQQINMNPLDKIHTLDEIEKEIILCMQSAGKCLSI